MALTAVSTRLKRSSHLDLGLPFGSPLTPNAYVRSTGGRFARRAILVCAQMFDESMLPDVTLGEDEPAMAKVLLVVSILGAMALLILYGVLFPGSDIPALGDVVSLLSGLANSGIWIFLIGILVGFGMIFANVLGGALED